MLNHGGLIRLFSDTQHYGIVFHAAFRGNPVNLQICNDSGFDFRRRHGQFNCMEILDNLEHLRGLRWAIDQNIFPRYRRKSRLHGLPKLPTYRLPQSIDEEKIANIPSVSGV